MTLLPGLVSWDNSPCDEVSFDGAPLFRCIMLININKPGLEYYYSPPFTLSRVWSLIMSTTILLRTKTGGTNGSIRTSWRHSYGSGSSAYQFCFSHCPSQGYGLRFKWPRTCVMARSGRLFLYVHHVPPSRGTQQLQYFFPSVSSSFSHRTKIDFPE